MCGVLFKEIFGEIAAGSPFQREYEVEVPACKRRLRLSPPDPFKKQKRAEGVELKIGSISGCLRSPITGSFLPSRIDAW